MKTTTVQMLTTARVLLTDAERLCSDANRFAATAGLMTLHDATELIFLGLLIELGVDEQKTLESFSFDQLIGELRVQGHRLPKSGTLKAMNKLRVAAKHYGQLMEPIAVQAHLNVVKEVLEVVVPAIAGKPLHEIFLTELLSEGEAKTLLHEAAQAIDREDFMQALISIRKAIFLEFERDYCVYPYRNALPGQPVGGLLGLVLDGFRAPRAKRNQEWITENVHTPCEYVQIDQDSWRMYAMERGINTQALANLRRLTPKAVQLEWGGPWHVDVPAAYEANSANKEHALYCMDLAIESIRLKDQHARAMRWPGEDESFEYPPAYVGQPLYQRPDLQSPVLRLLAENDTYKVSSVMTGFDPARTFYRITTSVGEERLTGYVERLDEPLQLPDGDDPAEDSVGASPP